MLTNQQRLTKAHISLMRSPQFCMLSGIIVMGESTVVAKDHPLMRNPKFHVACTDGKNKYYNPKAMSMMSDKNIAWVVAHENFHVMYRHLTVFRKLYEEDADTANIACDYMSNGQLRRLDPEGRLIEAPERIYDDPMFDGWGTKQIYDYIKKNGAPQSKRGSSGSGPPGDKWSDLHDWEAGKDMTPEDRQKLDTAIDMAIRQGDILAGKMKGNSAREAGAIPEPKINWKEQVWEFVQTCVTGNDCSTWRRPNRRWMALGMYLPTAYSEAVGRVLFAIDQSASVSNAETAACLAEVESVCQSVTPEAVDLLYWDTHITQAEHYEPSEFPNMLESTRPRGMGGTDPQCIAKWVDEQTVKPQLAIILTDGHFNNWPDLGMPTLWVITSNVVAPHGTTVKLDVDR